MRCSSKKVLFVALVGTLPFLLLNLNERATRHASTIFTPPTDKVQQSRRRFPSVEERLKVYLGMWYDCTGEARWNYEYKDNDTAVLLTDSYDRNASWRLSRESATLNSFWVDRNKMKACASHPQGPGSLANYCKDTLRTVLSTLDILGHEHYKDAPVLMRFGDNTRRFPYPTFQKARKVNNEMSCQDRSSEPLQPIIWELNTKRHYRLLKDVGVLDVEWQDKRPMAVFRGVPSQMQGFFEGDNVPVLEKCKRSVRCNFVYQHHNSTLVDAKLTELLHVGLRNSIDGRRILDDHMGLKDLLQYKGIVLLEGNDVATGLKWALLSQSVVLMPPPTFSSWAMEELLQPWVHYVPLKPDASDAEAKMQWVLDNDEKARSIAHYGSLWMQDLLVADADGEIYKALMERYLSLFAKAPSLSEEAGSVTLNENTEQMPKIALLMSFPNSGTSFTLDNTRQVSQRNTASNYGFEQTQTHPAWPDGPYLRSFNMSLPTANILTKTHCAGYCVDCRPSNFVIPSEKFFLRACLSTNHGVDDTRSGSAYSSSMVSRVVHLFRNPFDNIVARMHLTARNRPEDHGGGWRQSFGNSRQGLHAWCHYLDEKLDHGRDFLKSDFVNDDIKQLMKNVPCHLEWYRWTQWHNHAIEAIHMLQVPVFYLYYEDYSTAYNKTVSNLLEFLELPAAGKPGVFHSGKVYRSFYSEDEARNARQLVKALATPACWELIRHYFAFD